MDVLISIKPVYVEKICSGVKHFEYRKRVFTQDVERIYVYSSKPVQKIIGYFDYAGIISDTPEVIWHKTCNYSGIDFESYKIYFNGRDLAYALIIKNFNEFIVGVDPVGVFEKFTPPQSYMYIREGLAYEKLRNMV